MGGAIQSGAAFMLLAVLKFFARAFQSQALASRGHRHSADPDGTLKLDLLDAVWDRPGPAFRKLLGPTTPVNR